MDWNNLITIVATSLLSGGLCGGFVRWITVRDKKIQESEKTAQAHEATRQEEIETAIKNFHYLQERTVYAEEHIPKLHIAMEKQQEVNNKLNEELATLKKLLNKQGEIIEAQSKSIQSLEEQYNTVKEWVCYDTECKQRIRCKKNN